MTATRPEKAYLGGPMRGLPHYNFPAFEAGAELLRTWAGLDVVSPAEIDTEEGFVTVERDGDGTITNVETTELFTIEAALRRDFREITGCDRVVFLPGWQASSGAAKERRVAIEVGVPVYELVITNGTPFMSLVDDDYTPPLRLIKGGEPELQLIGLSGYARSGKDTVAGILSPGFERRAFADLLREATLRLDPLIPVPDVGAAYRLSKIVGESGWEFAKTFPEARQLLQRMGTEVGRELLGENIWVERAMASLEPGGRYVFSDVRFRNEADAVRNAGGQVWRIVRPGTEPINGHSSETALDGYRFDATVNNTGTLDQLRSAVYTALGAADRASTSTVAE